MDGHVYGPGDDDPPDAALIDITPAPFLPYAESWVAWLEHARTCAPCTRATILRLQGQDIYADQVCPVGAPLGIAVEQAITEQYELAKLN